MADENFTARVATGHSERANDITARLGGLSLKAVAVLDEAVEEDQPKPCRPPAAGASLRHRRAYRLGREVENRLRAVEAPKEPIEALLAEFGPE